MLVATTVIEVGVDVPNATVMVILDADRFGIAQLHQLRGRVGRGAHASTCWLVTAARSRDRQPTGARRWSTATDGFELAEVDLELRGEGTLDEHRAEGPQRPEAGVVAPRPRAGASWPATWPSRSSTPTRCSTDNPLLLDELRLLFTDDDEAFLFKN